MCRRRGWWSGPSGALCICTQKSEPSVLDLKCLWRHGLSSIWRYARYAARCITSLFGETASVLGSMSFGFLNTCIVTGFRRSAGLIEREHYGPSCSSFCASGGKLSRGISIIPGPIGANTCRTLVARFLAAIWAVIADPVSNAAANNGGLSAKTIISVRRRNRIGTMLVRKRPWIR